MALLDGPCLNMLAASLIQYGEASLEQLDQRERKVLEAAVKALSEGNKEDAVISTVLLYKITHLEDYSPSLKDRLLNEIKKLFNGTRYIDDRTLANFIQTANTEFQKRLYQKNLNTLLEPDFPLISSSQDINHE